MEPRLSSTPARRPAPSRRVRIACGAAALVSLCACHSSLRKPPSGPIPHDAWSVVPYPPPPAHVEAVPPPAGEGELWVDGQWDWDGSDWRWTDGLWMRPPPDAYFTPWRTALEKDGRFLFARAAWRARDGHPLDVPPGACPAPRPPAAPTTSAEVAKR